MGKLASARPSLRGSVTDEPGADRLSSSAPPEAVHALWPRRRATALALLALLLLQAALYFALTRRGFFVGDDFVHFQRAQESPFLRYLLTPILGVYPAPGHRLVTFLLQELSPLNYGLARAFFVILLGATTVVLGQLVRTLARSDEWWTVPLLAPFAFSLTLVSAVWWWSNGLPVLPGLFFTAIALSAWLRSYTGSRRTAWVVLTVAALAVAGAFYLKFLLIPVYLLLFRLLVVPRLFGLPVGLRDLWRERLRWIAVAVPPAAFLAVFVLSGLSARSVTPGDRPYLEYFAIAWSHAFVPVSFLNAPVEAPPASATTWVIVALSHVAFLAVVAATVKRSSHALAAWALFVAVFVANLALIGTARLPGFGVEIAYWLRYYPEVVFFLPIVLALALRQGEERRARVAWEQTPPGQAFLGGFACLFVLALVLWTPGVMAASEGVPSRAWFDNLRGDLQAVAADGVVPRLVDSESPGYVMASWLAPRNRVSRVLGLLDEDVIYNEWAEPMYVVLADGRLAEATFTSTALLLSEGAAGDGVEVAAGAPVARSGTCLGEGGSLVYRPGRAMAGERLGARLVYAGGGETPAVLSAETASPDGRVLRVDLRPSEHDAELVDLGTSGLRSMTIEPPPGGVVCIDRLEIGSLPHRGS